MPPPYAPFSVACPWQESSPWGWNRVKSDLRNHHCAIVLVQPRWCDSVVVTQISLGRPRRLPFGAISGRSKSADSKKIFSVSNQGASGSTGEYQTQYQYHESRSGMKVSGAPHIREPGPTGYPGYLRDIRDIRDIRTQNQDHGRGIRVRFPP
jgi:hypothetical protein